MNRPYDDIPPQGQHQGDRVDEEPSSSVRAQPAPHPPGEDSGSPTPAFGVFYNASEGIYRIRSWHGREPRRDDETYEHVGSFDALDAALSSIPERRRYVVLENPETGDIYYENQRNVTNWDPGDGYEQVTLFEDEAAAAAYVEARRRS